MFLVQLAGENVLVWSLERDLLAYIYMYMLSHLRIICIYMNIYFMAMCFVGVKIDDYINIRKGQH